jgi:hypothetical protein
MWRWFLRYNSQDLALMQGLEAALKPCCSFHLLRDFGAVQHMPTKTKAPDDAGALNFIPS